MNQLQLLLWNEFNVNNHSPKTNLMSLDMPELVPLDKHTKSEIPKSKISEIKNIMNDFASYYGIQDIDGHLPIYQKDMEALGQTQIQQIGSNNYKVKISLNPEIFKSYSKMMGIDDITIYHEFTHALTTPLLPYMTGISNNENFKKEKNYLFFNEFPIWLLYRNDFFDNIFNKMKRDSFKVYRDRAITNKYLNNSTGIKVLRSQNLTKDGFIEIKNYDKYIDTKQIDLNQFSIYKKIKENKQIMIVPNLSFKPRFAILPDNCIVNGSLGLFIPNKDIKINKKDLDFYNNDEFKEYYNIIRNKSYNSINLNNEIGFFIGILKKNDE